MTRSISNSANRAKDETASKSVKRLRKPCHKLPAKPKVTNLIQDNSLLKKVHQLADPLLSENPAVCEKLINRWLGGNLEYSEV